MTRATGRAPSVILCAVVAWSAAVPAGAAPAGDEPAAPAFTDAAGAQ